MPYIKPQQREQFDELVKLLSEEILNLPEEEQDGAMNYCLSTALRRVYPLRYRHQNRAIGMLNCVLQEHYRRVIGPYEDTAIDRNGDIIPPRKEK